MTPWVVFVPIVALLLIWAVWDILILAGKAKGPLVTDYVIQLSTHRAVPFLAGLSVGLLCGHFFL